MFALQKAPLLNEEGLAAFALGEAGAAHASRGAGAWSRWRSNSASRSST